MKKHKHKFQFVEKQNESGKIFAEFICLCGEQRIVEIKKDEKPKEN